MVQPNQQLHPEWTYTGPPCDFVPTETPSDWTHLLHVQTAAEALQTLGSHCRELDRQQYAAGSHALHAIIADLQKDAGKHRAALASGAPPTQPSAESVATAKALLANAYGQLPQPGQTPALQNPDPWHTAIFEMLRADALITATGRRRDEYQAAGPAAATAWRQAMDILAHHCRHQASEFQSQKAQTPAGTGRRARRRLLAQATGASRSALHAYHEAVAGPRRHIPVRYSKLAQEVGLPRMLSADTVRQVASSDAAPVVMLHLETDAGTETDPVLLVEHNSELHVLLDSDTMPPGLPAASLLESHLPQQIQDSLDDEHEQLSDAEPPFWIYRMAGLLAAAAAGIHDAQPEALQQLGNAIRTAVEAAPHAMAILEDAVEEQFGYYLSGWLFMQCRLLPTSTQEHNEDDKHAEPPFFTPEQNRTLLTAGAAAGISPYGLKRLATVIGADAEPDYIDRLPQHSQQTTADVQAALRQAIPGQTQIRQHLAHILQTELGISDTER